MSSELFNGKTVAITGGTGSFGRSLVKELLKTHVSEITIFSRDEEKQLDMSREFSDDRLKFVIGDVRDRDRVVEELRANYVYHAAALKIIPTCEFNPTEAYKTNLLGTLNVKEACERNAVEKAVLVSTDKAVKPVNTYGMTKALAEKTWLPRAPSPFSVVRYGNVVGSRGSIVPYFSDLIRKKQPLPITSRAMSRFLLTLKQAIELVFHATFHSNAGEIFIPKNPACKITSLAEAMAGRDYPTIDVGIRPGEKIEEILISEEEIRRTQEFETFYVVHQHGRFHNSSLKAEFSSSSTKQLTLEEIASLLREAGF